MMKEILLLCTMAIVLFSGCAKKVQVKALKPAEVGEMASKKKVAITSFKNDTTGLSSKIEAQIAKHKLDQKRYFTVLSRKDIKKVLDEQKLQSSELMDEKTASKIGNLLGAQALINGEVTSDGKNDKYVVQKTRCLEYYKDGGCARHQKYNVTCRTADVSVSASINIIDMETASLIYADNITKTYSGDSCKDGMLNLGLMSLGSDNSKILSIGQAKTNLTNIIANEFVYKLTPHYVYFNVTLLDSVEFEITDRQVEEFEVALEYINAGRFDKAEKIMSNLNDSLNGKSYVVMYDLGVIKEARGNFDEAKKLYEFADEGTLHPIDEINKAVLRINKLIDERNQARVQINKS